MKRSLVRPLIVGNVIVYALVAALAAYFNFFAQDGTTFASSDTHSNEGNVFLAIILPTPTPYGGGELGPSTPVKIQTLAPLETVLPLTPRANSAQVPIPTPAPVRDQSLVPPSAINIVLLGTDRRGGQSNWRTDTIILLSVNQQEKTVGLLSIPRDLYVNIPSIGRQRINTADFYGEYYKFPGGGPNLIKQTIEQNLGVRVHYYVRGGFDGFRKAIDTLGGVDVDVDCALQESNFYDDFGRADLNFQPGIQRMDGVTALRYARSRYTTNDYDRGRRQRKVLLAMWDKALSLNLLPKWPELFSQFQNSIQTDLGPTEFAALAWIGSQLKMDHIKSRAIDYRTGNPWVSPAGEMVLLPSSERIHSLLVEFFAPISGDVDAAAEEQARIQLVSGNKTATDIAGVALKRQGLNVQQVQALATLAATSSITVFHAKPATVQRLINLLRINPANVKTVIDAASEFDLQVNLGRDYNACQR